MSVTIVSPSAVAVKPRRHTRIRRADIPAKAIDPALRAFGRHIARSHKKRRGVHIPAMKNDALGQVLRALELKRAFN
ncbi:hypothetical protein CBU34_20375 [Salmonella enterica subsp. enterica serovar Muenchen]|uniref:hypothetical protein n=1 Tax=Salmonella enterica TaxID=28901 RepID=UPI001283198B|nr:hypothetical protein [Salmonella enterica]EBV3242543.1 hypothetical protein [Salmonella enterica subsp. enterica serovar Oranienburg]ECF6946497.1 hypothetical protein [Salmonella enterica subsp. diarizonae]ECM3182600.1 hypothetical protein [Salmonella enterica subsp. enterica serovar Newport]ECT3983588.1 hypothetical protein [Salmonella enterica subsp. houtenae serovar 53:z4,z23:-]ECT8844030.1 hypothetical protein [Salmonella enterica subsp. enterica serovar Muenchen]EFO9812157.1 hypotheti